MSNNKNNYNLSDFHKRFIPLLENEIKEWAKKIGVSEQNIRDNWFKGSYPRVDKIIKFLEMSGESADYLLTGKEDGSQPPQWMISIMAKNKYGFLKKIISEINEAAENDRSPIILAEVIIDTLEAELKKLREDLNK